MGEWSNLTQREKSNIIRFAIKNGVSDINQIRDTFNVYAKDSLANVDYNMAAAKASGFGSNGNGHYPDTFKKPNHPTFSDESKYHSEATPGGRWRGNTYEPSNFVLNQQGGWNQFLRGFYNQEQGTGAVPVFNGGVMLPEVTVAPQYKEGGSIHIKHPGRLTALKERTGKTEAELWATGNAHTRKMITFARNARKWHKHEDGGSNWLPDFTYNPSAQSDNGRQLVQSVLQDESVQRAVQQRALQKQAEIEAQRKAVSEIYNGMPNPGAGFVSGTDPLLQAVVDMTPAGDMEMATEAASELRNGNLKEAGLLSVALLLPNIFNKGIKEWRAARALKNNERGLVYTTRNNLTKYNPNLNEETIQALQQAERDYNNGLFTLEHQSELVPIFELGLHTPAGKTAYPEGVEVWYRGLSRSKGKQVGITPEEFEEMWDKNVAAGKYSNLFFGDLNTASSYVLGHTNPLEYTRITRRNFPKGDDSKLLQLVFPKGKALEIDVNGAGWADLHKLPFGKLSTKEEKQLRNMSIAYDKETKKQRLLQQRLDNYYKKHPEVLQSNSQSKRLQELQSKIDNSFYKVSDAHRKFMSLYKKKYPFSKTKDISDYLTHSNFSGINLYNIQDYGPALYLYGTPGNVSIRKPVPGNYGKSAIASDFKFDLNDPSIWAFGGNLKSTGGPLYPFSFQKNPYWKTPVVRY